MTAPKIQQSPHLSEYFIKILQKKHPEMKCFESDQFYICQSRALFKGDDILDQAYSKFSSLWGPGVGYGDLVIRKNTSQGEHLIGTLGITVTPPDVKLPIELMYEGALEPIYSVANHWENMSELGGWGYAIIAGEIIGGCAAAYYLAPYLANRVAQGALGLFAGVTSIRSVMHGYREVQKGNQDGWRQIGAGLRSAATIPVHAVMATHNAGSNIGKLIEAAAIIPSIYFNVHGETQIKNLNEDDCGRVVFPSTQDPARVETYRNLFNAYSQKYVETKQVNKPAPEWKSDEGNRFPDSKEVDNFDTILVCEILQSLEQNRQLLLETQLKRWPIVDILTEENMSDLQEWEREFVTKGAIEIGRGYQKWFAWGSGIPINVLDWSKYLDNNSALLFKAGFRGESAMPLQDEVKDNFSKAGGELFFLEALDISKIKNVPYLPWFDHDLRNNYIRIAADTALPENAYLNLPYHIVEELDPIKDSKDYDQARSSKKGVHTSATTPPTYLIWAASRAFRVTNVAIHPETSDLISDIAHSIRNAVSHNMPQEFSKFLNDSAEALLQGEFTKLSGLGADFALNNQKNPKSKLVINFVNHLLADPNPSFVVLKREDDQIKKHPAELITLCAEVEQIAGSSITLDRGTTITAVFGTNILSAGFLGAITAFPITLAGLSHPEALPGSDHTLLEIRKDELDLNLNWYAIPFYRLFGVNPNNYAATHHEQVFFREGSHACDPGPNTIIGNDIKTEEKNYVGVTLSAALKIDKDNLQPGYIESLAMAKEFDICNDTQSLQIALYRLIYRLPPRRPGRPVTNGHLRAAEALLSLYFKSEAIAIENKMIVIKDESQIKRVAALYRNDLLEASLTTESSGAEIGLSVRHLLDGNLEHIPNELYKLNSDAKKGLTKKIGYAKELVNDE